MRGLPTLPPYYISLFIPHSLSHNPFNDYNHIIPLARHNTSPFVTIKRGDLCHEMAGVALDHDIIVRATMSMVVLMTPVSPEEFPFLVVVNTFSANKQVETEDDY